MAKRIYIFGAGVFIAIDRLLKTSEKPHARFPRSIALAYIYFSWHISPAHILLGARWTRSPKASGGYSAVSVTVP